MGIDTSPFNPIQWDYEHARPASEAPPVDKITHDLAAMLRSVLAFKQIRVLGPTDLPPMLSLTAQETVLLVIEREQRPINPGGTSGTMGVRREKLVLVELQGIVGAVNLISYAQAQKRSQTLPEAVERAIAINSLLKDPQTGRNQLNRPMGFADEGLHVYPYGYMPNTEPPRPAQYRSRRMVVTIMAMYWRNTEFANVATP